MARMGKINGRQPDVRDLLLAGGVGQYTAQMSVDYMWMLPRTVDPYAQGVMQAVEGLQRLLNKRGAHLEVDGGLGAETVRALIKFSGPRWYDRNFAQLYGDVISGRTWPGYDRDERGEHDLGEYDYRVSELGSTSLVGDLLASPLPWIAGGFFVYWKWFRKGARR